MKVSGNLPVVKQKMSFKATLNEWQERLEQERVDPKGLCSHKFRTSDQFSGYLGNLADTAREARQSGVELPESFSIEFVPCKKANQNRFRAELAVPEGTSTVAIDNLLQINPGNYQVQGRTVNGKQIGKNTSATSMPFVDAMYKLNRGPRSPIYSDPNHPKYRRGKDVTIAEQLHQSLIGLRLPDKSAIQVDLI